MTKRSGAISLPVALLILLLAVLTGCDPVGKAEPGTSTAVESKTDGLDEAELTMYLLGDPAKDEDLVLAELNRLTKRDLNATVNVDWISWSDYQNKYPLVIASGEPIDLIYTSSWTFYASSAAKGAFLPLDELLPEYAPQTWKGYRKQVWEDARINGKIYAVPQDFDEMGPWGYVVRGDLMKKYNIPDIRTLEDFQVYLDAVKENEPDIVPYNAGSFDMTILPVFAGRHVLDSTQVSPDIAGVWSENTNAKAQTYILADDPRYEQFLELMRTWYEKGYWTSSILQNKVNSFDSFTEGKSGACIANTGDANAIYIKTNKSHPEWDVQYFEAYPQYPKEINMYMNNAMAIPFSARYPERAMMLLEKFHQDEEYFDLIHYGIKGRNYVIEAGGKVTTPGGPGHDGYPPNAPGSWGFNDRKFFRLSAQDSPDIDATVQRMMDNAVEYPLHGFIFQTNSVKTEVAACQNLNMQYVQQLTWGLADPSKLLPEFREKLHEAGIDRVKAEADKQIAEFLLRKNK